jgi:hypothetical protein
VSAVARHGKLVPVAVAVQPREAPAFPTQFTNEEAVTVATAALSTVMLNDTALQTDPEFNAGAKNPRSDESIRPSVVPTGDQLAAEAIDGITNADSANTTPKSNTLSFETFFM